MNGRSTDTFIVRIRRDLDSHPPQERWQVEHVQTGFQVYVHGLDDATAVIRSCLATNPPAGTPGVPQKS